MNKEQLQNLLDAEVAVWAGKSFDRLIEELKDVVAYDRGTDVDSHQFEVLLLEREEAYVHISISIDDGSFIKSFAPLTQSFILHRDGRIEM